MLTYIVHLSTAIHRKEEVLKQLRNKNLNYQFILEGDKQDLTKAEVEKYFSGSMAEIKGATSCAYKHILAYEKFLETSELYALILEDDVYFYKNFDVLFELFQKEINHKKLNNFLITLEDSNMKYIPRSQRKKGEYLYNTTIGGHTAAYIIDRKCAENMLKELKNKPTNLPIDWFHTACCENSIFKMYRSYPPLAGQTSLNGTAQSLIGNNKYGCVRTITYNLKYFYKKLLYNFR